MHSHNRRFKDGRQRVFWGAFALSLTAIVGILGAGTVRAQPNFPAKPVRISIPYGAGGVADLTMRLLAQKLTERTKQQVVIENRPGAGGLLSAKAVLDAAPDGYTLGVIGNGQAIAMSLFKTRPYHVLTDFTFVSMTARFEMLLAVKDPSGRTDRRRTSPLVWPRGYALRPLALRPGARPQARRLAQRRPVQGLGAASRDGARTAQARWRR